MGASVPHLPDAQRRRSLRQKSQAPAARVFLGTNQDPAVYNRAALDRRHLLARLCPRRPPMEIRCIHLSCLSRHDDGPPRQGLLPRTHLPHPLRCRRRRTRPIHSSRSHTHRHRRPNIFWPNSSSPPNHPVRPAPKTYLAYTAPFAPTSSRSEKYTSPLPQILSDRSAGQIWSRVSRPV